jgi:23S rRNA (uracil1939-C5)-methyltransferase
MLSEGQQVELSIEKPAAGGRMIARHDGRIVLVAGAVPGEWVVARIERVERRLAFATTVEVREPSPDRRAEFGDPLCGGCVYSHVLYPRQLALKWDIIRDAFARIGHMTLDTTPDVASSPERGYRMRARLHADRGRIGFYREGTHALCDAALTGQLSDDAVSTAGAVLSALEDGGASVVTIELTENIPGDERAFAVEVRGRLELSHSTLEHIVSSHGLNGCSIRDQQGTRVEPGDPGVSDSLAALTMGRVATGALRRHPESFFQANRYLLPALVASVLDFVPDEGDVIDLYAGVGLFSVALAGSGRRAITSVEGDRTSGTDLQRNAGSFGGALKLVLDSVERYLGSYKGSAATVIVDPPRTGISAQAMTALVKLGASRIIYVSCDPPTMARDAGRLVAAGYALDSLRAFDLFPNTPHVEALGVFRYSSSPMRR